MHTEKELFLLAKLNAQQAVLANLTALFGKLFAMKGTDDFIDKFHHNMRESMRTRAVIKQGQPGEQDMQMQAMALDELDYFFAMAKHYAEKN